MITKIPSKLIKTTISLIHLKMFLKSKIMLLNKDNNLNNNKIIFSIHLDHHILNNSNSKKLPQMHPQTYLTISVIPLNLNQSNHNHQMIYMIHSVVLMLQLKFHLILNMKIQLAYSIHFPVETKHYLQKLATIALTVMLVQIMSTIMQVIASSLIHLQAKFVINLQMLHHRCQPANRMIFSIL